MWFKQTKPAQRNFAILCRQCRQILHKASVRQIIPKYLRQIIPKTTALAALVAERAAPAVQDGRYIADVLIPVAQKLAGLAQTPPSSMGPEGRGTLFHSFAHVVQAIGIQRGDSEALEEAVAACSAALQEWTRERVPLRWAMTQNNLGNALGTLGERESGTARLEEAVAVMKQAWNVYRKTGINQYPVEFESRWEGSEDLIAVRQSA
jgi:hypothetical protein